jgi:hypothetical protein
MSNNHHSMSIYRVFCLIVPCILSLNKWGIVATIVNKDNTRVEILC